jgi:hypothetical protein
LRTIAPQAATNAYIALLNSDNPDEINKAGRALGALKAESAVLPLIERVITKRKHQIGGGSSTNVGFGSQSGGGGGGGFTFGNEKSKIIEVPNPNADVLGALTSITGENFQYDKDAWLDWYGRKFYASAGDLRRDQ